MSKGKQSLWDKNKNNIKLWFRIRRSQLKIKKEKKKPSRVFCHVEDNSFLNPSKPFSYSIIVREKKGDIITIPSSQIKTIANESNPNIEKIKEIDPELFNMSKLCSKLDEVEPISLIESDNITLPKNLDKFELPEFLIKINQIALDRPSSLLVPSSLFKDDKSQIKRKTKERRLIVRKR